MREIKFRGKRIDTGEWVYGSLLQSEIDINKQSVRCEIHARFASDFSTIFHEVVPETVGQYTGLKDKDEKEIYEGDVGKVNHGDPFAPETLVFTVFENGSFGVYPLSNQTDIFGNKYTGKILNFADGYNCKTFQLIGNIHDNQEICSQPQT